MGGGGAAQTRHKAMGEAPGPGWGYHRCLRRGESPVAHGSGVVRTYQAGPIDTRVAGVPLDKLSAVGFRGLPVCFRPPLQGRGLQLVLCNSHFGHATPRQKATRSHWLYRQNLEAGLLIPDDHTRSPRHAGLVVVPRAPPLDHATSVEGSNRTPPATYRQRIPGAAAQPPCWWSPWQGAESCR